MRTLAAQCVEVHRPKVVLVENVPEMRAWTLYPAWRASFEALGYALAEHVIDAADHGVPQHRRRLYVVATRSRAPLRLELPRREHVAVADVLDLDTGTWAAVDRAGRSRATLARIEAGRAAFGERFLAPYYGSGSGLTGRSLARPCGTITTRDRWALVDGDRMRMLSVPEYARIMGFPAGYHVPTKPKALGVHLLGNAVCPPVVVDLLTAIHAQA